MSQLIDIARVSADNAKRIAGGILCSGMGNTQTELLAQAVADLATAVEALAEQCEPRAPVNQLGQVMPKVVPTLKEYTEYDNARTLLNEIANYGPDHATTADVENAVAIVRRYESPFIGPATCEDVLGLRLDNRPWYERNPYVRHVKNPDGTVTAYTNDGGAASGPVV